MAVPYTFGSATSAIPLSQLDSNFATAITLGSTALTLGTTTTTVAGLTLTSPTLTTPALGTPSSGVLTNCTGYPSSAISGTISLTTQVTGTLPVANGGTGVTTSTGTGSVVLSTSPTLVTPALGTPSSITLTNATGLPISTGLSGLTTTGVAYATSSTALATGSALKFDGTNLGVGVTPSAWSTYQAIQLSSQASLSSTAGTFNIGANVYYGSGGYTYIANGEATLYQQSAGVHLWRTALSGTATNPITFTQAMTLDASGNLLVGTTNSNPIGSNVAGLVSSPGGNLSISRDGNPTLDLNRYTSDGTIARFYRSATQVGSITVTTVATAYLTASDSRLKNNQAPLSGSGDFIDALKPKTWNWVQDGSKGAGFIAHEFAEVSPSSVSGEKDAVDADGNPVYQAIQAATSEVIANLVAEIQSLRKRIATLENK